MIIDYIKLTDFGQHKYLDFDCGAPIVGLLGSVGSGKSTVLTGLIFALTGGTTDTLDSYIRQGAESATVEVGFRKLGQVGRILRKIGKGAKRELHWDNRVIKAAKDVDAEMAKILGADKHAVSAAVDIKQGELMQLLFGMDSEREALFIKLVNLAYCDQRAKTVDRHIARLQGTITDLSQARAQVLSIVEASQRELTTAKANAANARDYRDVILWLDQVIPLQNRLEVLNTEIQQAHHRANDHQAAILHFCQERGIADPAALEAQTQVLKSIWQQKHEQAQKINRLAPAIRNWKAATQQLSDKHAQLYAARGQREQLPSQADLAGQVRALEDTLQRFYRHDQLVEWFSKWEQRRIELEGQLAQFQTPPYNREALQQEGQAVTQLFAEMTQRNSWLTFKKQVLDHQKSCCPTCGTHAEQLHVTEQEIATLAASTQEARQAYTERNVALREATLKLDTWESQRNVANTRMTEHLRTAESPRAELSSLISALAHMEKAPLEQQLTQLREQQGFTQQITDRINSLEIDIGRLKALRQQSAEAEAYVDREAEFTEAAYIQAQNIANNIHRQYEEEVAKLAVIQGLKGKIEAEEATVTQKRAEHNHKSDQLEELSHFVPEPLKELLALYQGNDHLALQEARLRQENYNTTQTVLKEVERQHQNNLNELANIDARQARDKLTISTIEKLDQIKFLLSRKGLPGQYVAYRFAELARLTQKHLSTMNAKFQVEADPEAPLCFRFTSFATGATLPMGKLSGGQRVQLSLAFLMAVQEALVPEVGLLVLDEPTHNLGPDEVTDLSELLRGNNSRLNNAGAQIWISTHDILLEPALDRSLRLGTRRLEGENPLLPLAPPAPPPEESKEPKATKPKKPRTPKGTNIPDAPADAPPLDEGETCLDRM